MKFLKYLLIIFLIVNFNSLNAEDKNLQIKIKTKCKETALKNDYKNQVALWKNFLDV